MPETQSPAGSLIVAERINEIRREVAGRRRRGERVGVVPTMGALHAGHLSLIETARRECACLVVTIFVNPTQFGPDEDYQEYPRPLEADLQACRQLGVDLVFRPEVEVMFSKEFTTFVEVDGLSNVLEGKFRPGHFRGVTTVVLKLFHIIGPDVAYFGRKDFQQQVLVRRMCGDLNLNVEIRTCPTVRDPDGLALSSRNSYLSRDERQSALSLSECLQLARDRLAGGETDVAAIRGAMRAHLETAPGVTVDYATIAHPATLKEISEPLPEMVALVAARVGKTRLIDNMLITGNRE